MSVYPMKSNGLGIEDSPKDEFEMDQAHCDYNYHPEWGTEEDEDDFLWI
jgi:hypothetical protein